MSSRREEKERRREERLQAERAEAASSRRNRFIGYGIAALLGLAVLAGLGVVIASGGDDDGGRATGEGLKVDDREGTTPPEIQEGDLNAAVKAAGCKLTHPDEEGSQHLGPDDKTPKYDSNPPTSGNHDPVPTEDGAYLETSPARNHIHTLEHGRILIQYSPELPEEQQLKLKGLYDEDPAHMLLFPNADMPYEVAATAWTHLLGCDEYNDGVFDAIRAFKDRYRDRGPEFVP